MMASMNFLLLLIHLVSLKPPLESKACKSSTCVMAAASEDRDFRQSSTQVSFHCVNNVSRKTMLVVSCSSSQGEVCSLEMRSHQTNEQASDTPALLSPSCHHPTTKISETNCHAPALELDETYPISAITATVSPRNLISTPIRELVKSGPLCSILLSDIPLNFAEQSNTTLILPGLYGCYTPWWGIYQALPSTGFN